MVKLTLDEVLLAVPCVDAVEPDTELTSDQEDVEVPAVLVPDVDTAVVVVDVAADEVADETAEDELAVVAATEVAFVGGRLEEDDEDGATELD